MKYYKDTNDNIYAEPNKEQIDKLGLTEVSSPIREDGTVLPNHEGIADLEKQENGKLHDFYLPDGTPDWARINARNIESVISRGEALTKQKVQDVVDTYNKAHSIRIENITNCPLYASDDTYEHQQFCVDVIAYNVKVWKEARAIQSKLLNGEIAVPNDEEYLVMLPEYEGVM